MPFAGSKKQAHEDRAAGTLVRRVDDHVADRSLVSAALRDGHDELAVGDRLRTGVVEPGRRKP
jgi:hypothetical protein